MNHVVIDMKDVLAEVGAEESFSLKKTFEPIKTETTEIEFIEPVKIDIKAENTGSGIRVKGHIKSALKLVCSRCLNDFNFPVDWRIDELFLSAPEPGDEAYSIKHDSIDLGPPTEEEFVLAIPIKPLCNEACKGICPICGEPITGKHKPHEEVKIDKRFEILKELLKEQEQKEE